MSLSHNTDSAITVVVVDDSAFMRKAISTMLSKDPEIKVLASARDGEEGLEFIRKYDPDVVTLDIEMPRMDGLKALRHIMMEMPRPVLMISSLTTEGAESTLKAMELGAVDFIPKQLSKVSLDIVKIEDDLRNKVKTVARRKLRPKAYAKSPVRRPEGRPADRTETRAPLEKPTGKVLRDVVAVGVSTGGPPAVQKVLAPLEADFPASILIAQHMPAAFTGPFAKRLDSVCKISVREASGVERLAPGTCYIAPGGKHLLLDNRGGGVSVVVAEEPSDVIYKPSANVLLSSVSRALGHRSLGVILTGMGSDGLEGVRDLKARGGRALTQSDATCVVYGMPKAIVDAGLSDEIVDIDDMSEAILHGLYK
jgi:two-component system chemotaxis response regulator CheB